MKKEAGEWGSERRLCYLKQREEHLWNKLKDLGREASECFKKYNQDKELKKIMAMVLLTENFVKKIIKELVKVINEIHFIQERKNFKGNILEFDTERKTKISSQRIARAKEYLIEDLVDVKNNLALCLFHYDYHPSMRIYGNRFYCFACGARGDVIDIYMKLNNVNFSKAVMELENRR